MLTSSARHFPFLTPLCIIILQLTCKKSINNKVFFLEFIYNKFDGMLKKFFKKIKFKKIYVHGNKGLKFM